MTAALARHVTRSRVLLADCAAIKRQPGVQPRPAVQQPWIRERDGCADKQYCASDVIPGRPRPDADEATRAYRSYEHCVQFALTVTFNITMSIGSLSASTRRSLRICRSNPPNKSGSHGQRDQGNRSSRQLKGAERGEIESGCYQCRHTRHQLRGKHHGFNHRQPHESTCRISISGNGLSRQSPAPRPSLISPNGLASLGWVAQSVLPLGRHYSRRRKLTSIALGLRSRLLSVGASCEGCNPRTRTLFLSPDWYYVTQMWV
jgi:hypothetical protein